MLANVVAALTRVVQTRQKKIGMTIGIRIFSGWTGQRLKSFQFIQVIPANNHSDLNRIQIKAPMVQARWDHWAKATYEIRLSRFPAKDITIAIIIWIAA